MSNAPSPPPLPTEPPVPRPSPPGAWLTFLFVACATIGNLLGGLLLILPYGKIEENAHPKTQDTTSPVQALVHKSLSDKVLASNFLYSGKGPLWAVGMMLQCGLWSGIIAFGVYRFRKPIWIGAPLDRGEKIRAGVLIMIAITLILAPTSIRYFIDTSYNIAYDVPLYSYPFKFRIFYICGTVTVVFILRQLWRIERRASSIDPLDSKDLIILAGELRLCLLSGGLMLTLAVLTASALRSALNLFHERTILELETVFAFGAFNTFVLLVIYAPAHIRVVQCGERLLERLYPIAPTDSPSNLITSLENRAKLLKLLGVSGDWGDTLKSSVLVLSPFLASLTALLLPSK